jgi:iron complex transport system ATP-binding protein
VSERAAALSCLFQEQHAAFDFEVLDYAALGSGRGARGERERSAWAALARVGLAGCARRRWSTLSGGERQRAALARCLAAEARVLLLDEVTNHLDLRTRSDLAELLAVERQRGHTIVVATHDLELASMADRIVILSRGHVAAAGDPSALLSTCALAESFGVRLRVFPDPSTGAPVVRLGSNDAESSTFATQPYPLRTQP